MLAGALSHNESALRASFQAEYGLRLLIGGRGRTEPHRTPVELADLYWHLPFGSPIGKASGGVTALSDVALLIRDLEHTVRHVAWQFGGASGKEPEAMKLPLAPGAVNAEGEALSARARAYQERQARRTAGSS